MAGARVILSGRRQEELERVRSACIQQGIASRDLRRDLKEPLVLPLDLRWLSTTHLPLRAESASMMIAFEVLA